MRGATGRELSVSVGIETVRFTLEATKALAELAYQPELRR